MSDTMSNLLKQAQEIQKRLQEVQEAAAAKQVTGSAGGGMVVATATGRGEVVALKIDREVVDPDDVEMLQDLVVAATNQALRAAQEMMKQAMAEVTGGIDIPGLL